MSQGLSQIDLGIFSNGVVVIDPNPPPPPPLQAPVASGTFDPSTGVVGNAYLYATAGLFTGGEVVSYALIGTLPDGLSFSTVTGEITGTPTTDGTSGNLSVTGTNGAGSDTTNTDTMTINPVGAADRSMLMLNYDCENASGNNDEVFASGVDTAGLSAWDDHQHDDPDTPGGVESPYAYFDNTEANSGAFSIRCDALEMTDPPPHNASYKNQRTYGFKCNFADAGKGDVRIAEGDEVWIAWAQKIDDPWSWSVSGGAIKWIAFQNPFNGQRTYCMPLAGGGSTNPDWRYNAEGVSPNQQQDSITGGSGLITRNIWDEWEVRVKNSFTGSGEMDLWKNGTRVAHLTGLKTINVDQYYNHVRLGKHWNDGLPQDQTMRVDDIAIAVRCTGAKGGVSRDDTPFMKTDSHGNPYIGVV